jgi:hypothetical protein
MQQEQSKYSILNLQNFHHAAAMLNILTKAAG